MSSYGRFFLSFIALALPCTTCAYGHVESTDIAADLIIDRDRSTLEVRVPIRELILSEQPIDAPMELANLNQDPEKVAQKHGEEVMAAFHITYDGKELKAHLMKTAVRSLVIGVSEEDLIPRVCGVFTTEYVAEKAGDAPKRVDITHTLFKLPLDAGFQPTVLCAINYRQADKTTTKFNVLGHDDDLKIICDWSAKPAAIGPAPSAGSTPAFALPVNAVEPPKAEIQPPSPSRGPLIVVILAGAVLAALAVVLARKRA